MESGVVVAAAVMGLQAILKRQKMEEEPLLMVEEGAALKLAVMAGAEVVVVSTMVVGDVGMALKGVVEKNQAVVDTVVVVETAAEEAGGRNLAEAVVLVVYLAPKPADLELEV